MNIAFTAALIIAASTAAQAETVATPTLSKNNEFVVESHAVVVPCTKTHPAGDVACVSIGEQQFAVPTWGYRVPVGADMVVGFTVVCYGDTLKIINIFDAD
jgi:hypothetical protein